MIKNTAKSKQNNLPVFPDLGSNNHDGEDLSYQYGSGMLYSSDELRYSIEMDSSYSNERTSLLPPPGVNSQEQKKKNMVDHVLIYPLCFIFL